MVVTCRQCGQPIPKRRNQSVAKWQQRPYCSRPCSDAAKRGVPHPNHISERYVELRWLLDAGTAPGEALVRCGIRSAEAAYRWGLRHGDRLITDTYRAAASRINYRRRKASA